MSLQCISVRSKKLPGERCTNKAAPGISWCGKHRETMVAFAVAFAEVEAIPGPVEKEKETSRDILQVDKDQAALIILRSWQRWIAKRAGPLLRFREESNNPFDFFNSDPVEEIPFRDFISFVDAGKGYCMDVKSVTSLLKHAATNKEEALNPFNRAPLPPLFLRRIRRHVGVKVWSGLEGLSESQKQALEVTDVFRKLEELGNYTDPEWFLKLSHIQLQQLYLELADIWFHRATLTPDDRARIVPGPQRAFSVPVRTALIMRPRALRPLLISTCNTLVSAAAVKGDRQLGGMYVLGALAMISSECAAAFPWLAEMFMPGVTCLVVGLDGHTQLVVTHASVLAY